MVTLDCLAAFDHLVWLRTGARAAEVLSCDQSTISRHAKACQSVFGVKLVKRSAEWHASGDASLLTAERKVHQLYRWCHDLPLRFDAQHWFRERCQSLPLPGWNQGNLNYFEYHQPHDLLKQHILDAWLCSAPDAPTDDTELTGFQLCSMPSYLIVKEGHPLLQCRSLELADLQAYPLLPLPHGAFPVYERMLASLGLGGGVKSAAQPPVAAGVPVEDLMIGIATPLTLPLYGTDWQVLPLQLPLAVGDVLMVRTELAEHHRTRLLLQRLLEALRLLAREHEAVRVIHPRLLEPGLVG